MGPQRWEIAVHPSEVQHLVTLWRDGVSTRRMAKELGMSLSTLWQITRRLDLPRRAVPRVQRH